MNIFKGTLNRTSFVVRTFLPIIFFVVIFGMVFGLAMDQSISDNERIIFGYFVVVPLLIFTILYTVSIVARRLRGIGLNAWLALLVIPALIMPAFLVLYPILFFIPSIKPAKK